MERPHRFEGFADFYRSTNDRVFRAVLLATRQPDRAEDAVADAYATVFARWDDLQHHPNLVGLVTKAAMNRFRSGWRVWHREFGQIPDLPYVAPPSTGLDGPLLEALWRLPRRQREVIGLRILADLDTAQTAAALGIAPKTVTVHLHRALMALRLEWEHSDWRELA